MDPVSIAGVVGPTLKTLYSVTTTLYTFITSAKKVDKSLEDLNGDVRGLTRVLEDIETSLKDTVIARTSYATSRKDGSWGPIHAAIQDTHSTVEDLEKVLDGLGPPGNLTNGFKKAVKQVQLNINSDEITSIKLRVHWHSTILQMALQTATLSINCLTNDNVINVVNPKIDIILSLVPRVESLIKQVGNVSAQLATKHDKLPKDFRILEMTEHTQQLRCTAEAVIATANTVIESQSTVVKGEDRQYPSSFRDLSQELKKYDVTEWISHLTVDHEELGLESDSTSELMPDDSISRISLKRHKRWQQINEPGMPESSSRAGEHAAPFTNTETGRESSAKNTSEKMFTLSNLNQEIPISTEEDLNSDTASEKTQIAYQANRNVDTSYNEKSAKKLVAALKSGNKAKDWTFNDALLELAKMKAGIGLRSSSNAVGTLRYLLEKGADVNAMDAEANTALHHFSEGGNTALLNLLVELNAEVEMKNKNGYTALHLAARLGHTPVVEVLLNNDADIEQKSEKNQDTALSLAAKHGQTSTVEYLLKAGANIHARLMENQTALSSAAQEGHSEVASVLVNAGSSVDAPDARGCTSLYHASFNGHVDVVDVLLRAGASVDVRDENGYTPLHSAAGRGHTEIVKTLLKAEASVDAIDKHGWTPLHLAADYGYTEIVETLLKAGASVDVRDDGSTPLHSAVFHGHTEVVKALLKAGASVNAIIKDGYTPLHLAARYGYTEIVETLLKAGASVDVRNKNGWTPLSGATSYGYTEIVKTLLKAGASVNITHEDKWTSLHLAVRNNYTGVVETLLKAGASVDIRSGDGRTPLHLAVLYGNTGVAETLLKAGASVDVKAKNDVRPLMWATNLGQRTHIELLLAAGADIRARSNKGETLLHQVLSINHFPDCLESCAFCAASETRIDIVKLLCGKGADPSAKNDEGVSVLSWVRTSDAYSESERKALIKVLKKFGAK